MKKKMVKKKLAKKTSKKALKKKSPPKRNAPSKAKAVTKKKKLAPKVAAVRQLAVPEVAVVPVLPPVEMNRETVVIPAELGQPMTFVRAQGVGKGVCAVQTSSACIGAGEQELSIFVVGADREGTLVCGACLQERLDTLKWKVMD